jgi:zinc D-Ala-D-Ala carboxypeptidase
VIIVVSEEAMKHFKIKEFDCPCCGKADMDSEFLQMIDHARRIAQIPFVINSGYRCDHHNGIVGGKPNSAHMTGNAADIKCLDDVSRYKIVSALIYAGFKRIGVYKTFIHADNKKTEYPLIFLMEQ